MSTEDYDYIDGLLNGQLCDSDDDGDSAHDAPIPEHASIRWTALKPSALNTKFTINQASDDAWLFAQNELKHMRSKIPALCGKDELSDVTDEDLVGMFFSKDATATKILMQHLNLNLEEFFTFMARLCLLSLLTKDNTNVSRILELFHVKNDVVGIMSEEDFNKAYKRMSQSTKVTNGVSGNRRVCVWEKIQSTLNDKLREISIIGREGTVRTVVDDDKNWCHNSGSNAEDRHKVKYTVHTRDNRRGFTIHVFASQFNFFPMYVEVETDETTAVSSLVNGLNHLFGHGFRADGNFVCGSDRGYLGGNVVLREVLKKGGDILGTTRKSLELPYTTSKLLGPHDSRTLLDPEGSPCLFASCSVIEGKMVTATAFKNGTKGIATAISSTHHGHWWDAKTVGNTSVRPSSFFKRMQSEYTEEMDDRETWLIDELLENVIDVITVSQGRACWHTLRKFSLTSSQSHQAFHALFPHFWNKEQNITDDDSLDEPTKPWKAIAEIVYGPTTWQAKLLPLQDHDGSVVIDKTEEARNFKKYCLQDIPEIFALDDNDTKAIVDAIADYVEHDKVLSTEVATLNVESMSNDYRKLFMHILMTRINDSIRVKSMKKSYLVLWLSQKNKCRKWMFYQTSYLDATASSFGIKKTERNTYEKMCTSLASYENTERPAPQSYELSRNAGIEAILQHSFHTPFTGSRRADCELGHRNEPKLIKKLITYTNRGQGENGSLFALPGVNKILGIYTTGLVSRKDANYARDSIDFIMIVGTDTGIAELWGGEVKTRTRQNSKDKEVRFQRNRFRNTYTSTPLCTEMHCSDLHSQIANINERTQLLHHASIYNLDKVIFVIGDWNCNFIHIDIVQFSFAVLADYTTVLENTFDETLAWAYPTIEGFNDSIPSYVIDVAKKISNIGGENQFLSTYHLWRTMMIDVTSNGPYPELERIIPMQHAAWNPTKPSGDTITQLIEKLFVHHPHIDFETRPTTRLIQYMFVCIHKLRQICTARNTTDFSSITSYRHAGSKRTPFILTMKMCFNVFGKWGKQQKGDIPLSSIPVSPPNLRRGVRRTTDGKRFVVVPSPITPLQFVKRRRTRGASIQNDLMKEQQQTCRGPIVAMDLKTAERRRCAVCQKKTIWMCQGCQQFYCNQHDVTAANAGEKSKTVLMIADPDPKRVNGEFYFVTTCFLVSHPSFRVDINT